MKASHVKLLPVAGAMMLAAAGTASAQFDLRSGGQQRTAEQLTRVQIVPDSDRAVIPGETIHLAVVFTIEAPWHLYWKNPGEGALPPSIKVEAPEGFTVGETRWPRPKRLPSAVGDMYCYEGEFALFVPITAPEDLRDGEARFTVTSNWAVCDKDMCLFGSAARNVTLQTTSSTIRTLEARPLHPMIAKHRPRLSQPLREPAESVQLRGDSIRVTVPANGHDKIDFFPHQSPGVTYGQARFSREGERHVVEIDLQVNPNNFLNGPPNVGGLIALGGKPDDPSFEFSVPLASR